MRDAWSGGLYFINPCLRGQRAVLQKYTAEAGRGGAAAATWIFRGAGRRVSSTETRDGRDVPAYAATRGAGPCLSHGSLHPRLHTLVPSVSLSPYNVVASRVLNFAEQRAAPAAALGISAWHPAAGPRPASAEYPCGTGPRVRKRELTKNHILIQVRRLSSDQTVGDHRLTRVAARADVLRAAVGARPLRAVPQLADEHRSSARRHWAHAVEPIGREGTSRRGRRRRSSRSDDEKRSGQRGARERRR